MKYFIPIIAIVVSSQAIFADSSLTVVPKFDQPIVMNTIVYNSYANLYKSNMTTLSNQAHKDRYSALLTAYGDIKAQTFGTEDLNRIFYILSEAALAEGDQRNTIFTRDALVKALSEYHGEALKNYLGIIKAYGNLLSSKYKVREITAGPEALRTAAEDFIYKKQLEAAKSQGTVISKSEKINLRDDARVKTDELFREGCFGEVKIASAH